MVPLAVSTAVQIAYVVALVVLLLLGPTTVAEMKGQDILASLFPIEITELRVTSSRIHYVDANDNPKIDLDVNIIKLTATGLSNKPAKDTGLYPAKLTAQATTDLKAAVKAAKTKLPADTVSQVARQVGIGAIVFANLAPQRDKDIDFDIEHAVALDGDSGPYIQYTHARAARARAREAGPSTQPSRADSAPRRMFSCALRCSARFSSW